MNGFGVEHVSKADKHAKEAGAVAGGAVVANEGRAIYQNKHTGRLGQAASSKPHEGKFRDIKGVSDAPAGTHFSQSTHPEGVYNVSTQSLARARQRPAPRRGQDQLRDTLRTKGFDRPVHMKVYEDGKARIWDGHHRTTRASELGLPKVPVSVTHVKGNKPKPKSITEAAVELRHHRYRGQLLQAARLAKRGDTMISAFGVEHVIEKGVLGAVKDVATAGRSGLKGGVNMFHSGTAASGAFKVGKFTRVNAKPLAIGGGVGLAAGGRGLLPGSRKNY